MRKLVFALVIVFIWAGCKPKTKKGYTPYQLNNYEVQGHRGCRGLYPENTIPAFIQAIKLGVKVLELDVCISQDSQVVVSHEPWMNYKICLNPDGTEMDSVTGMGYNFWKMKYSNIKQFDCGSKVYSRFPDQFKIRTFKPLLSEVIDSVEKFCMHNNLPTPKYNIELKSEPQMYEIYQPKPEVFVKLVDNVIRYTGIYIRTYIQSFDPAIIKAYKKVNPLATFSYLTENKLPLLADLRKAGFMPKIYSPDYTLVTKQMVDSCHVMGIRIIPWTVNDTTNARILWEYGVDGIITDYPNLIK